MGWGGVSFVKPSLATCELKFDATQDTTLGMGWGGVCLTVQPCTLQENGLRPVDTSVSLMPGPGPSLWRCVNVRLHLQKTKSDATKF